MRLAVGGVQTTPKYKVAEQTLALYPEVTHVVGHSLGASVGLELATKHELTYDIYARPGFSWRTDPHAHRHFGDVISVFDRGATSTYYGLDPISTHSYEGGE